MSTVPGAVLNEMFLAKLDTAEGKEKIAAYGGNYIRDRLREESFARQILKVKSVTKSDLQVSTKHDTLVMIVEMEPFSRGMSMSFRGQPEAHYYTGSRFEVPFHTVGSLRYEQTEQELMAYKMPITKIIRRNIVNDLQEVEDTIFLDHIESACQSLQKDGNRIAFSAAFGDTTAFTAYNVQASGGGTAIVESGKVKGVDVLNGHDAGAANNGVGDTTEFPIQKDDLIKLFQLFTGTGNRGSRLRCDQFLMTDTDFEDINAWALSDMGDKIVGETTVDGYKYKTLIGRKFVRTLKTDILRPGNIYAFAAPEFLGGFCILNKTKFYADKERNKVSFEAWEDVGMYIGNVAAVRKLELYAGAVEDGLTGSGLQSTKAPKAEEDLGQLNHLVEEDQYFPQVLDF